jgi:hypothetical protein
MLLKNKRATSPPKKKLKLLKKFAVPALAMMITLGGIGTATFLSQKNQDIRNYASTASFQVVGHMDRLSCDGFKGWVWDPQQPNLSISVHIYERLSDGTEKFVTGGAANGFRGDVAAFTRDNGFHEFNIPMPKEYMDGSTRSFVIYGFDHTRRLYGGIVSGGIGTLTCTGTLKTRINLIPQQNILPIEVPRPTKLYEYQCSTSSSNTPTASEVWIGQKSNDGTNLCSEKANSRSPDCHNATITKLANGLGTCIWNSSSGSNNKIKLLSNSAQMPNKGCSIHSNNWNRSNPGGYSSQIVWDFSRRNDYKNSTAYQLGKIHRLILKTGFSLDKYSKSTCPAGIIDPITGITTPVAQSMIGLMFNEVNSSGNTISTVFYQLMTYDSRAEFRKYEKGNHVNCGLSNSTSGGSPFLLIDNSLAYYGQKYPLIGKGMMHYELNLMPQIVAGIRHCRGNSVNLDNYRLSGVFFSNETMNTAGLTSTYEGSVLEIF